MSGKKVKLNKFSNKSNKRCCSSKVYAAAAADPDRPLWFPGSVPPPWLDGSLPGDFGFDPLGLGRYYILQFNLLVAVIQYEFKQLLFD